jgi:hypothetical protein
MSKKSSYKSQTSSQPPQIPSLPNFLANESTRKKFCALYDECLETLSGAFPECDDVKTELVRFRTDVQTNETKQDEFIRSWHDVMNKSVALPSQSSQTQQPSQTEENPPEVKTSPKLYELADKQNNQFWHETLPWFVAINMSQKVKDIGFTEDHINILWEYIQGMNKHSRIYNAISKSMLDKIQSVAMDCVGKFQRGEMKFDLENLNFDEIKNLGQSLMQSFNPEELQDFTGNLTGLAHSLKINNVGDVFKFVGDLPGMSNVMGDHSQFTGLLDQIFQSEATQNLMQNVDKMFNNGNGNDSQLRK